MMKRRSFLKSSLVAGATVVGTPNSLLMAGGALTPSIAQLLDGGMVWCHEKLQVPPTGDVVNADFHAVFVKDIELVATPKTASIHLFAFTRYRLYVNGEYVGRGPNRFQNQRPEYDTRDIARYLHPGKNVIAVLVHCDSHTGRIQSHAPGFTAVVDTGDGRLIASDPTWRSTPERSFGPRRAVWSSIPEAIDAREMPDWADPAFNSSTWPPSVRVPKENAFPVWPRTGPVQSETLLVSGIASGRPSVPLSAGQETELALPMIAQVYHRLTFDADAGSKLQVEYLMPEGSTGTCMYVARQGKQTYLGGDTFAAKRIRVKLLSGKVELHRIEAVEVRYPFERLGSFTSSDPFLEKVWNLCARSIELFSEDAYVDCADRERVEWMDCSPPGFECSRVMMAGPGPNGQRVYSDPRLLQNMLRRIALTAPASGPNKGMMKAHSCSDRFDIHAFMEDRSCDWVIGLRQFYESTGDKAFVKEMWPALTALMKWFLDHRTERGLVLAREWEVWDNPLRYQVCEGTGLNAFVYRALADAAYLGAQVGYAAESAKYAQQADDLAKAINTVLWSEKDGTYHGGFFGPGSKVEPGRVKEVPANINRDSLYVPTIQAALFMIDLGVVPPDRLARVRQWALNNQSGATLLMSYYFLFRVLYAMDRPDLDLQVLNKTRAGWKNMVESPWQTSWEYFSGGSKVHIYGIFPAYFLSSYVLGVRLAGLVGDKTLLIEPRPTDLDHASGVVVTEFGPVPISWKMAADKSMALTVTVPEGAKANVRIPAPEGKSKLAIDGVTRPAPREGSRLTAVLLPGKHTIQSA